MNAQTHRLIFNKARGCLMAVGENVSSSGRGACSGARRSRRECNSRRAKVTASGTPETVQATGADPSRQEASDITVQGSSIQAAQTWSIPAAAHSKLPPASRANQARSRSAQTRYAIKASWPLHKTWTSRPGVLTTNKAPWLQYKAICNCPPHKAVWTTEMGVSSSPKI